VTFKFFDFEITPIVEEFSDFTELPIIKIMPVFPSDICKGDFPRL